MKKYYYETHIGVIEIVLIKGRWTAVYDDEYLAFDTTPQRVVTQLCSGDGDLAGLYDTSMLSLPEDLSEWAFSIS